MIQALKLPNICLTGTPLDQQILWSGGKRRGQPTQNFKKLPLQGTSVPSERVFSKARNIITKKRNRLGGENASSLIFLSENLC